MFSTYNDLRHLWVRQ